MFEELKRELKRFGFKGLLATVSYLSTAGFVGIILSEITLLGKWGYLISFLALPYLFNVMNWLSGTKIFETFWRGWLEASIYFHLLVILNALIWSTFLYYLSNLTNKPLWIIKKTFGK